MKQTQVEHEKNDGVIPSETDDEDLVEITDDEDEIIIRTAKEHGEEPPQFIKGLIFGGRK